MKIGIDIRMIGKKRTGDEVVFFNMIKNLAQIDHDNFYELFACNITEDEAKFIALNLGISEKQNFKITILKSKNKFTWNLWTLPNYLKIHPLDVYQTQYITPWFVSKKTKIVTIVHDISFRVLPEFIGWKDLFLMRFFLPLSFRRADKIIAVSEFTKNQIMEYYKVPASKIQCIYNGLGEDFALGEASEDEVLAARKKYNLPEEFILYLGTLQPRKNVPMLINAFLKICGSMPNMSLVICGNRTGHHYDKKIDEVMSKTANSDKRIVFPGFINDEDKRAIFKAAHVYVLPSRYEGFGIPLLEAMSQSVPVVASDIACLKEIAGEGALFFNVESIDEFSKTLYTACIDKNAREKLIQIGRERIGFFSWEKSAEQVLVLYVNLLHN